MVSSSTFWIKEKLVEKLLEEPLRSLGVSARTLQLAEAFVWFVYKRPVEITAKFQDITEHFTEFFFELTSAIQV